MTNPSPSKQKQPENTFLQVSLFHKLYLFYFLWGKGVVYAFVLFWELRERECKSKTEHDLTQKQTNNDYRTIRCLFGGKFEWGTFVVYALRMEH